eukprot:scaffold14288_cov109-Isochrysis_galbana.AAC.2
MLISQLDQLTKALHVPRLLVDDRSLGLGPVVGLFDAAQVVGQLPLQLRIGLGQSRTPALLHLPRVRQPSRLLVLLCEGSDLVKVLAYLDVRLVLVELVLPLPLALLPALALALALFVCGRYRPRRVQRRVRHRQPASRQLTTPHGRDPGGGAQLLNRQLLLASRNRLARRGRLALLARSLRIIARLAYAVLTRFALTLALGRFALARFALARFAIGLTIGSWLSVLIRNCCVLRLDFLPIGSARSCQPSFLCRLFCWHLRGWFLLRGFVRLRLRRFRRLHGRLLNDGLCLGSWCAVGDSRRHLGVVRHLVLTAAAGATTETTMPGGGMTNLENKTNYSGQK